MIKKKRLFQLDMRKIGVLQTSGIAGEKKSSKTAPRPLKSVHQGGKRKRQAKERGGKDDPKQEAGSPLWQGSNILSASRERIWPYWILGECPLILPRKLGKQNETNAGAGSGDGSGVGTKKGYSCEGRRKLSYQGWRNKKRMPSKGR